NEAIAGDLNSDELIRTFCQTVCSAFHIKDFCLLVKNEDTGDFDVFKPAKKTNKVISIDIEPSQLAWLARVNESFPVSRFIQAFQNNEKKDKLIALLGRNNFHLGVCLSVTNSLSGVLFIGEKRGSQRFTREDRQLLNLLVNTMSLELHRCNLRQIVHDTQQMESIYRVTSFMMHDLRNVVSTLSLLTQNAEVHIDKKAFRKDFVATLDRVSREMLQLTDRLSSIKTGAEKQQLARCYPAQMLAEVLDDLQIPNKIAVSTAIENLPSAKWDENQIRVVLRNLIKNAVEAMPGGGALQIDAKAEAGWISFSVVDSGVGMAPEFIRSRLFKPNQTTKPKGLGIGMYQSREIVRLHGGEILVESVPGKGTTMAVRLPIRAGAKNSSIREMPPGGEDERESWRVGEREIGRNGTREIDSRVPNWQNSRQLKEKVKIAKCSIS
ncbi:MAG: ATP-binding protein, partial [bacterium]